MPASVWLVLVLVLSVASLIQSIETDTKQDGFSLHPEIIWQGFHFQWLRKEFGFETPHRLGSFATYINNISTSECSTSNNSYKIAKQNCTVFGAYHVEFTPGVSGDYAFPRVYYQTIATSDSSKIMLTSGNITFSFKDNSTTEPVLHASTSKYVNITLPLLSSFNDQLILQGFQVDMKCIPTPDHPCNSNAIWPYYFNISLTNECSTITKEKVVMCPLFIGLARGWTPSHGGGKPYNYCMAYNVTVFYMRIQYSTISSNNGQITLLLKRLRKQGDIYQAPLNGQETLNMSSMKQSVLLGITEISWNLIETDDHLDRGRYLEELVFFIRPLLNSSDGKISFMWMIGYRDPTLTTYPSNIEYSLGIAALIAPTEILQVSVPSTANGSVCMDNKDIFSFHCSKLGLKSTTRDTINISGTI